MNFTQRSKYHLDSDDRRYVVAKVCVDGQWHYEGWKRRLTPLGEDRLLGICDTVDEAKAVCERDCGEASPSAPKAAQ